MDRGKENRNIFKSDIEDALKNEKISYGTALILENMSEQERAEIYKLVDKVHLGSNKMKEVVENLYEISKRDNLGISDILKEGRIASILSKENIGKKEKGEQLRKVLDLIRYPLLNKKKELFFKKVNDLRFSHNIKIKPNENFETDEIYIKISVSNIEELKTAINEINEKIESIDELFLFVK